MRHEVVCVAVMTVSTGQNLVFCHPYPPSTCVTGNGGVCSCWDHVPTTTSITWSKGRGWCGMVHGRASSAASCVSTSGRGYHAWTKRYGVKHRCSGLTGRRGRPPGVERRPSPHGYPEGTWEARRAPLRESEPQGKPMALRVNEDGGSDGCLVRKQRGTVSSSAKVG